MIIAVEGYPAGPCSFVGNFIYFIITAGNNCVNRPPRLLIGKFDTGEVQIGLQLEVGKDCVRLMYGDGVPVYLGQVVFNPYGGEGNEFNVSLDELKRYLSGKGSSARDGESIKRALEHGLGQKFDTVDELVSKMESLRGPELCDVWCNSVKEANNLSVLYEQQTLAGFKAVEYNSKVDEARARQQKAEQKIVVENYQKVKVGPKLS